jgi:hypothetical protein
MNTLQLRSTKVKREKWSSDPKEGPLGSGAGTGLSRERNRGEERSGNRALEGAESGRGTRGRAPRFEREHVNSWTVRHIMRMIFQPALGPFPSPHKWAIDSAPTRLPSLEGIFGATFHCCQGLPALGFRPFTSADLEIQPVDIPGTLCASVGHSTRFPLKICKKWQTSWKILIFSELFLHQLCGALKINKNVIPASQLSTSEIRAGMCPATLHIGCLYM